jgi:serine/threonine protein phosphatase PrpC
MGVLGVSRSFGDKELKQWVPADPEVVSVPLRAGDDFLVLACDGLWDVADNDIVSELVRKHTAAAGLQGAACALTTFAIRNGSTDNVTCMIVQLGEKVSAKNVGDKGKVERKTVIA